MAARAPLHRYTEPGLRAELLKGADRQLAALLGTGKGSERVLLGWLEVRTVGDAKTPPEWKWNDNDPRWSERREVDPSQQDAEEAEDRAGLELHREDEHYDHEHAMTRIEPPAGLPMLAMGRARRRDVWVEGLRTLDGARADYGRIAVETCELATVRRLGRRYTFDTGLDDVARRWRRAMAADGGGPAPQAHRTLLAALRKNEEAGYAKWIAAWDLDEAGAEIVANELRSAKERGEDDRHERLDDLVRRTRWFAVAHSNRSGAVALLKTLLADDAGLAIAERLCACEGREAVEHYIAELKREEDRKTYQRRREARFTRDYPGDGIPEAHR